MPGDVDICLVCIAAIKLVCTSTTVIFLGEKMKSLMCHFCMLYYL